MRKLNEMALSVNNCVNNMKQDETYTTTITKIEEDIQFTNESDE